MHENRLGKTNGFTGEPLDMSSESEIFAFDTLGVSLADSMLVRIKVLHIPKDEEEPLFVRKGFFMPGMEVHYYMIEGKTTLYAYDSYNKIQKAFKKRAFIFL